MVNEDRVLEFYARPSGMTSAGRYASALTELPTDVDRLVRIIQHLVVYDVVAPAFYGFTIPKRRQGEIQIRSLEKMLDRIFALDARPLPAARPLDKRLIGRCHHFMLLMVGILRTKGIPARGRCGFGSYFNPPQFEDHWVCEYWRADQARWVLVDAQLDEIWRAQLTLDDDILDMGRDRFLIAADAWTKCRRGEADPARFGIEFVNLRGLWFIAGSLVRDVAALNGVEMLPWDVWGAQPRPNEPLDADQLAFFDTIAALTREPDPSFADLTAQFQGDDRLRVRGTVFNALLNRTEAV